MLVKHHEVSSPLRKPVVVLLLRSQVPACFLAVPIEDRTWTLDSGYPPTLSEGYGPFNQVWNRKVMLLAQLEEEHLGSYYKL